MADDSDHGALGQIRTAGTRLAGFSAARLAISSRARRLGEEENLARVAHPMRFAMQHPGDAVGVGVAERR